ncbi:MAG: V-type ATPase subunit [Enterocloster clostridioformis]
MADKQYVYAVARIRSKELSLLSGAFLEQLTAAKDYDECIQLLMEKGWGEDGITNAGDILAIEKRKTWELINELLKDMSVFDVFLYANDYHNLKAAIKEVRMGDEYPGIFMDQGTVDVKLIREAVQTREFQNLPAAMRTPAEEAYKALLHTQDGQLCDIIIDKAALDAIYAAGKSSGNEFLELYAELTVAAADIKTAVRASRTGKDRVFLEQALAPCGSINVARLAQAVIEGVDSIGSYLETTAYADAVEELRRSPQLLSGKSDNLLIRKIKPQQYSAFGLGPLAAYILGTENEIKSVRIVLSGKLNHLPEESIRERIREMYV